MNELTKQMQQIMHPRAVLVAYECETTDYSTREVISNSGPSMRKDGWGPAFR